MGRWSLTERRSSGGLRQGNGLEPAFERCRRVFFGRVPASAFRDADLEAPVGRGGYIAKATSKVA